MHDVQLTELVLRFHDRFDSTFVAGNRYHIRFKLSRAVNLLQHAAVNGAQSLPKALLFPPARSALEETIAGNAVAAAALPRAPYHRALNALQKQAVLAAMQDDLSGVPYVIFGAHLRVRGRGRAAAESRRVRGRRRRGRAPGWSDRRCEVAGVARAQGRRARGRPRLWWNSCSSCCTAPTPSTTSET